MGKYTLIEYLKNYLGDFENWMTGDLKYLNSCTCETPYFETWEQVREYRYGLKKEIKLLEQKNLQPTPETEYLAPGIPLYSDIQEK